MVRIADHAEHLFDKVRPQAASLQESQTISFEFTDEIAFAPANEIDANKYAYHGTDCDPGAALSCEPSRCYDATTGMWLSTDPIGYCPGGANYCDFVANDPMDGPDPHGL